MIHPVAPAPELPLLVVVCRRETHSAQELLQRERNGARRALRYGNQSSVFATTNARSAPLGDQRVNERRNGA
jgi:hypothetical protein